MDGKIRHVHNNSQATRIEALQMGANMLQYVLWGKSNTLNHESRAEKHYYNSCSCNWIIINLQLKTIIGYMLISLVIALIGNRLCNLKIPSIKGKKLLMAYGGCHITDIIYILFWCI